MRDHDDDWAEYRRHVLKDDVGEGFAEVLRMAFNAGRLAGLAALGEAAKPHGWRAAWRKLTGDALRASEEQAGIVLGEISRMEAEEAERN